MARSLFYSNFKLTWSETGGSLNCTLRILVGGWSGAGTGSSHGSRSDFSDPVLFRIPAEGEASIGDGAYFCQGFED